MGSRKIMGDLLVWETGDSYAYIQNKTETFDIFRFYFVMELKKIVLLPIPTGWRDSNSSMGDGLSKLNGFFQLHHSWGALFCVRI